MHDLLNLFQAFLVLSFLVFLIVVVMFMVWMATMVKQATALTQMSPELEAQVAELERQEKAFLEAKELEKQQKYWEQVKAHGKQQMFTASKELVADTVAALEDLGYSKKDALQKVYQVLEANPELDDIRDILKVVFDDKMKEK